MALKFTLRTHPVEVDGEEIATVRGLSLNEIVGLINLNREIAETLFESFNGRDPSTITQAEVGKVGMGLITHVPEFVAQIIAAGSDAYDSYEAKDGEPTPLDTIMRMSASEQLACLLKIGEATFKGDAPKKLLGLVLVNLGQNRAASQKA